MLNTPLIWPASVQFPHASIVRKDVGLFNPFSFAATLRTNLVLAGPATGLRVATIIIILHPMLIDRAAHMCRCCWMRSRTTGRAGDGIGARARVDS
jgi:hypothetical protein